MARGESTGRKPGTNNADFIDGDEPPLPRYAMSIERFCKAHEISEEFYYKLQRNGQGPRLMRVGSRTLISVEAAADRRRKCEQITKDEAKAATAVRRPAVAKKKEKTADDNKRGPKMIPANEATV